jgi:hypothetical protein
MSAHTVAIITRLLGVFFIYNQLIFFYNAKTRMTKAILIREKLGDLQEIELDIAPHKNEIFKILEGRQTFIGQWPEIDVVIMKAEDGKVKNENTLPHPFDGEEVHGKILLVRMDEQSEPQDFTLRDYRRHKRLPV